MLQSCEVTARGGASSAEMDRIHGVPLGMCTYNPCHSIPKWRGAANCRFADRAGTIDDDPRGNNY